MALPLPSSIELQFAHTLLSLAIHLGALDQLSRAAALNLLEDPLLEDSSLAASDWQNLQLFVLIRDRIASLSFEAVNDYRWLLHLGGVDRWQLLCSFLMASNIADHHPDSYFALPWAKSS